MSLLTLRSLFIALTIFLISCSEAPKTTVKLGLNQWPGYEFLFLAEQKGFFKELDLNVELVQLSSLPDVQRAYVSGRIDAMASTVIESVQATLQSSRPLKVVLLTDYSNGGDVIIAKKSIENVEALRGKRVGVELGALGLFFLQKALAKYGMKVEEVRASNVEQNEGEQALLNDEIDAFFSYPPVSLKVLENEQFHQIFSSAEIPYEIIDVVSIEASKLKQDPTIIPKLHKAWQMALDYTASNPEESYQIMADREGMSAEAFQEALSSLVTIPASDQHKLLVKDGLLKRSLDDACDVLKNLNAVERECSTLPDMIFSFEN